MAASEPCDIEDTLSGQTEIRWNEELTDLNTFDNGSGLPHVVKYEGVSNGAGSSLPPGLRIYAEQPVLLHTRTCKRHVRARTIYHDKQGPYYEVGQTLDIPEDFDGIYANFILSIQNLICRNRFVMHYPAAVWRLTKPG